MDRVYRTNLRGVFSFIHTVVPHMLERDYGRVVNIASVRGQRGQPSNGAVLGHQGRGHRTHKVCG